MIQKYKCRMCNPLNPIHIHECYVAAISDADLVIECIGGREELKMPWEFRSN